MMTRNLIKDYTDCDSDCVTAMFHWGTQDNIAIVPAIQRVRLSTYTCEEKKNTGFTSTPYFEKPLILSCLNNMVQYIRVTLTTLTRCLD